MKFFIKKNYKKLLIIGLILSIIYILVFIRFAPIDFDENYTLSLINHHWHKIIYLTSLDVHPPLYYIILKSFIDICTFWTSSMIIKVFIARLLSVIITIVSFFYLYKIIKVFHINNNIIISWISFILLPYVLGINFQFQQMTNIRMYALAGLFIVAEFYYLLKFRINFNNFNLFLAIIFAILSAYTHYYSAIFAGLLLFLYFIRYVLVNNLKAAFKLFLSGVLFIVIYIPWIKILLHQINSSNNYWINHSLLFKQVIIYVLCVSFFVYPIFIYFKKMNNLIFKEQILFVSLLLLSTFIFAMFYGIMKGSIFIVRYMYPILLIYEFIGVNTMIHLILRDHSKIHLYYSIIAIVILLFNASGSFFYQFYYYNIPSISAIHNYHSWNKNNKNTIHISKKNVPMDNKYFIPSFGSLLYTNNSKHIYVYSDFVKKDYDINNIAYKKVFNDINSKMIIDSSY